MRTERANLTDKEKKTMGMTVSISKGRTAILHDIRKEISANVDEKLIYRNEIFINELEQYHNNLVEYTDAHFQPYIDEYNVGKKPSRQIQETYTEHLAKENEKLIAKAEENKTKGVTASVRKPTQLAHEYVLQFGNRENNSTMRMADETEEEYHARIQANREGLEEVLDEIQKKYPHAHILLATFHADEPNGTPHMHILVQFEGEEYQRGLSHQISMSKALELDGLERSQNRGDYAINRWTKDISDNLLTPALEKHMSQDREILDEGRTHEDIRFFRQKAKAEAEALQQEREATKQVHDELDAETEALRNERTDLRADNAQLEIEARGLALKVGDLEAEVAAKTEETDSLDEQIQSQKLTMADNDIKIGDQEDRSQELATQISDREITLDSLTAEISQKTRSLADIDRSFERITEAVDRHEPPKPQVGHKTVIDQPKGIFQEEISHKEYRVIIPTPSREDAEALAREIGDLYTKQYAKEGLKELSEASVTDAQEQANQMLAQAQETIDRANEILREEEQHRAKIRELKREREAYQHGWTDEMGKKHMGLDKLKNDYRAFLDGWRDKDGNHHKGNKELLKENKELESKIADLQTECRELEAEVDSKLAFVDQRIGPAQLRDMLDDSTVTNLVQDTVMETCKQLEDKGLVENASVAFINVNQKTILNGFKDRVTDFIDRVKDHIQEMTKSFLGQMRDDDFTPVHHRRGGR